MRLITTGLFTSGCKKLGRPCKSIPAITAGRRITEPLTKINVSLRLPTTTPPLSHNEIKKCYKVFNEVAKLFQLYGITMTWLTDHTEDVATNTKPHVMLELFRQDGLRVPKHHIDHSTQPRIQKGQLTLRIMDVNKNEQHTLLINLENTKLDNGASSKLLHNTTSVTMATFPAHLINKLWAISQTTEEQNNSDESHPALK